MKFRRTLRRTRTKFAPPATRYHLLTNGKTVWIDMKFRLAQGTNFVLRLFCDVERPLKYRWATAFNRWFSRNVMAAAAAVTGKVADARKVFRLG